MGSIALLKSGLVGGLGLMIAIVAVISLLTFASQSARSLNTHVSKVSSIITLIIVWIIGWGISYWYFSTIAGINSHPDETVLTALACLFTLTPSFAIICAALSYYIAVQKMQNLVNKENS